MTPKNNNEIMAEIGAWITALIIITSIIKILI